MTYLKEHSLGRRQALQQLQQLQFLKVVLEEDKPMRRTGSIVQQFSLGLDEYLNAKAGIYDNEASLKDTTK